MPASVVIGMKGRLAEASTTASVRRSGSPSRGADDRDLFVARDRLLVLALCRVHVGERTERRGRRPVVVQRLGDGDGLLCEPLGTLVVGQTGRIEAEVAQREHLLPTVTEIAVEVARLRRATPRLRAQSLCAAARSEAVRSAAARTSLGVSVADASPWASQRRAS